MLKVFKTSVLSDETKVDVAEFAVTVFGDADGGDTFCGSVVLIFLKSVIFRTIDEQNHVGILLDCAGFAQVGKDRFL